MDNGHLHARRLDERGRHQRVRQHYPQRGYRLHLWPGPRECHLEYIAHMGTWKHVYSGENFNNHFEIKAIKKARSFFGKKRASFFWWCLDINGVVKLNSDGNEKNNFEHLFSGLLHFYSSSSKNLVKKCNFKRLVRPGFSNIRPAGRMWPATGVNAARDSLLNRQK